MEFPEPLKSMLTEVRGQSWKDIRSILTPAFTSGKLKSMMYIMNEAGHTLLKKIEKAAEEKQAVDIHESVLQSSFDIFPNGKRMLK